MKNDYQIIDHSNIGLPFVEVYGKEFDFCDLYELVGRPGYMTTFQLKPDSKAYQLYGPAITGLIAYDLHTLQKLKKNDISDIDLSIIKINTPDFVVADRERLKYVGILLSDVEAISFFAYRQTVEKLDTGEKKVPNIIEVAIDNANVDVVALRQSYLVKKNNNDAQLIGYEKEELIGITLGLNNGHIDSRILKHFGFNEEEIKRNMNVWYHVYKTKEIKRTISDKEKERYSEIKDIRAMERMMLLIHEINQSGATKEEINNNADAIREIAQSLQSFSPRILLYGKKQVYWDEQSYTHIAVRHLKDYQLGKFKKEKTPFSYRAVDLELLAEKVLSQIKDEYHEHLKNRPDSMFSRTGPYAVEFNGDYYNIRIASDGRLIQFHPRKDEDADA